MKKIKVAMELLTNNEYSAVSLRC